MNRVSSEDELLMHYLVLDYCHYHRFVLQVGLDVGSTVLDQVGSTRGALIDLFIGGYIPMGARPIDTG